MCIRDRPGPLRPPRRASKSESKPGAANHADFQKRGPGAANRADFPKTWEFSASHSGPFCFFLSLLFLFFVFLLLVRFLLFFYCLFCSYGFSLFLLLLFLRFPRRSCRSRVGSASRSCTLKKKQAFCGGAARAHGETATAPRRGAEFGGERAAKITFQNGAFCIITSQLSLPLFPIILTAAITIYYSLLAIG